MVKNHTALLNLVHSFYLCDWREITSKARKGQLLKEVRSTGFLLLTLYTQNLHFTCNVTEETFESD